MVTPSRQNAGLIDYLSTVDSPTLANAIEVLKCRDRVHGYIGGRARCQFPDLGPMVGHAVTVEMTNSPGHGADRTFYWKMWEDLERAETPSVLVVKDVSGEPDRVAFFGEVMATMARRLGAVGLVTDGGVRDLDEVQALGLQYFAPFPVVSHGNYEVVSVGRPVSIFGQRVDPGDLLHGDKNGVVIIPDCDQGELEQAVQQIRDRERSFMDFLNGDDFTLARAREVSGY